MNKFLLALPLVFAFVAVPVCVKADDTTPTEKPAKGDHGYIGVLAAKPADAKDGVVAVLNSKRHKEEKTYSLVATGDVAKQVADFLAKGTKVQVKGEVSGDTITVASINEAPAHKKKDPSAN